VLDALPWYGQVFGDLAPVVRALLSGCGILRRARHCLALQPGQFALDVEVAHLPELNSRS